MFLERIYRLFITFLVGILLVRYLGPEQFGLLSYAISFIGLFSAIGTLGLDSLITRELVNEPEKSYEILGSSFALRIVGALTTFPLIGLALIFTGDDFYTSILIYVVSLITIFQSFNIIDYYFQSIVKSKYSVYVLLATSTIASIIKLCLIFYKLPLMYFAIVTSVEYLIMALGYIIVYQKKGNKILKWKFSKRISLGLLKDSWPLILSGLAIAIYMKIGQVIIKNLLNEKEVGYYAAAVRLCEAWYFIPMAITSSLFPAIINAKKISIQLYFSRLQKLYDILAWVSIGIALIVTLFAETIVKILLGIEYLPSSPVLTIYIWAGVPTFLGVASSQYLLAENLTKISFYRTLSGMLVNVVLNYLLIPKYGIVGSAYATLISFTVATISIFTNRKSANQLLLMVKSIFFIDLIIFITKYVSSKFNKT